MSTSRSTSKKPAYSLSRLRELLQNDFYFVTDIARETAKQDFGWRDEDIKQAILSLKKKHFYKTEDHFEDPSIKVDFYKARGLMGVNIYTHFHVEDGELIISSFKRI